MFNCIRESWQVLVGAFQLVFNPENSNLNYLTIQIRN